MLPMNKETWDKLNIEEKDTLGLVKSGVILHLLTVLNQEDPASKDIIGKSSFRLAFKAGSNLRRQLDSVNGILTSREKITFFRDLTLKGKTRGDIGALLTQKDAKIIPLPGSLKFLKAGKIFAALAKRIPEFLGGEEGKKNPALQTRLLLDAALMGVVQVGNYDGYVKKRLPKMGSGIIEVQVLGRDDLNRFIQMDNCHFSLISGAEKTDITARLIFNREETVQALLSGKIRAMSALGDGRIQIRGKLPMIQGLFPLLDRFSFFMKVK